MKWNGLSWRRARRCSLTDSEVRSVSVYIILSFRYFEGVQSGRVKHSRPSCASQSKLACFKCSHLSWLLASSAYYFYWLWVSWNPPIVAFERNSTGTFPVLSLVKSLGGCAHSVIGNISSYSNLWWPTISHVFRCIRKFSLSLAKQMLGVRT